MQSILFYYTFVTFLLEYVLRYLGIRFFGMLFYGRLCIAYILLFSIIFLNETEA
jgi:hypothetical protein